MQTGCAAAEAYLAAWRPILAERPDSLWYPTLNVCADMAESISQFSRLIGASLGDSRKGMSASGAWRS